VAELKGHYLHQVLLETGQKCSRSFQNVDSSFWKAVNVTNTSFCAIFQVQKYIVTSAADDNTQDVH
jgi:hypothetical protein